MRLQAPERARAAAPAFSPLFLLPALLLVPWLMQYIYLRGAAYSDLLISHYPNLRYLHDSIAAYGAVPLWSPAIQSGFPYFANPLSGLWYPPGWLAAVWPEAWAFNLLAAAHLVFGAWGMARLLGRMGLDRPAGLLGGLAFGVLPKLLAHYGAGHVTLVYAVSWTPWLLEAELLRGRFRRPAVVLAVIFAADPRWAAYAGPLWAAFSFAHSRSGGEAGSNGVWRWLPRLRGLLLEGAFAALLAAPVLLPLLEFAARSTRAGLSPQEVLAFSLPLARLAGILLPLVGGQVEWTAYAGTAVLPLAVAGALAGRRRQGTGFWVVAAVLSLLVAMGDQVPVLRLWASIPGANLLRVPARALFLMQFSIVVLASEGFHAVSAVASTRRLRLLIAAWAGTAIALAAAGIFVTEMTRPLLWSGGISLAAAIITALLIARPAGRRIWAALLFAFVFADGAWFFFSQLTPMSPEEVFAEGAAPAAWLAAQPGRFRVYSPSYSIPQHTAAVHGMELADGVDPLQLQAYANYFSAASGVPYDGYSVTLPPLEGDVAIANRGAQPDAELLGRLNVLYVASAFDLAAEGLQPVARFGDTRIYLNLHARSRIFLADESGSPGAVPELVSWSPNRIVIDPRGSEELVLSEIDYPGWIVQGGELKDPASGILRVVVPDHPDQPVTLSFRPTSLLFGLLFALAGSLALLRPARRS